MNARAERRRRATDELIDRVAMEELDAAHPDLKLKPVAVVIAAYHEADNIGRVVTGMPAQIDGEDVSVVVVVDGEDDGTAAIVRHAGQVACIAPVNRGQGAALRLGYRIAYERGAHYVVTADADGQSEPADLAVVLEPVMSGEFDFVNGSRRLGSTEGRNLARNTGVVVFASLITLLTRTTVTDPANPIRAMRADVPVHLALDEPQYQASELLIGAAMRGFRIAERPVSMLARSSGESKKGGTLAYGARYGRVVFRTWWRERAYRTAAVGGQAAVTPSEGTP